MYRCVHTICNFPLLLPLPSLLLLLLNLILKPSGNSNFRIIRGCYSTLGYSSNGKGRDSSVGTATRYELGSPGIECRWGRDFQHSICGMLRGKTGATSSTTNPTRTGPRSNPSLCGEKSAINTMSHGTVFEASNPRE
jgi:hypothetical protein